MLKNLFHSKTKRFDIASPVTGRVYSMEEVPDGVFSQKMLGDGVAVEPEDGDVYSPVTGTVVSIFPTKHAIGLKSVGGTEILLHLGIDTVALNGVPFTLYVQKGDAVTSASKLAHIDLEYLQDRALHDDVIVVFTDMSSLAGITITQQGTANHQDIIGFYTLK